MDGIEHISTRVGADVLMYSYTLYRSTQFEVLECARVLRTRKYSILVLEYIHKTLILSEYSQGTFTINGVSFSIYFHLSLYLFCCQMNL